MAIAVKQVFDNVGEEIILKVPNELRQKKIEVFLIEIENEEKEAENKDILITKEN